jgi:dynactin complex subunit
MYTIFILKIKLNLAGKQVAVSWPDDLMQPVKRFKIHHIAFFRLVW